MKNKSHDKLTFKEIEDRLGIEVSYTSDDLKHSLPQWHMRIRETPLSKLTIDDLCIACRQEMHMGEAIPFAVNTLKKNPLAGYSYDGELLVALKSIQKMFWEQHQDLGRYLKTIIDSSRDQFEQEGDSLKNDVQELEENL